MKIFNYLCIALAASSLVSFSSCHSAKKAAETAGAEVTEAPAQQPGGRRFQEPRARAYRTNGDYADKVMVVLGSDGKVSYFPAINEVDASSAPARLAQGYLLDSRGIGPGSVFTTWTYDEYSKLPATPTEAEIKAHIIPGSQVTEIVEIPLARYFARTHTAMCDEIINNRPGDLIIVYKR